MRIVYSLGKIEMCQFPWYPHKSRQAARGILKRGRDVFPRGGFLYKRRDNRLCLHFLSSSVLSGKFILALSRSALVYPGDIF